MTITPIRKDVETVDPVKQQFLDTVALMYDGFSTPKPVALMIVMVNPTGTGSTQWHITGEHEHQASLYLARSIQIGQIDLHNYQHRLDNT